MLHTCGEREGNLMCSSMWVKGITTSLLRRQLCVYIYNIYMCIYIHIYMYIHIYIQIYMCVYVCV